MPTSYNPLCLVLLEVQSCAPCQMNPRHAQYLLKSCQKQGIDFINATRMKQGYIMRRDYGLQPSLERISSKQGINYKMNNSGSGSTILCSMSDEPKARPVLSHTNPIIIVGFEARFMKNRATKNLPVLNAGIRVWYYY